MTTSPTWDVRFRLAAQQFSTALSRMAKAFSAVGFSLHRLGRIQRRARRLSRPGSRVRAAQLAQWRGEARFRNGYYARPENRAVATQMRRRQRRAKRRPAEACAARSRYGVCERRRGHSGDHGVCVGIDYWFMWPTAIGYVERREQRWSGQRVVP